MSTRRPSVASRDPCRQPCHHLICSNEEPAMRVQSVILPTAFLGAALTALLSLGCGGSGTPTIDVKTQQQNDDPKVDVGAALYTAKPDVKTVGGVTASAEP